MQIFVRCLGGLRRVSGRPRGAPGGPIGALWRIRGGPGALVVAKVAETAEMPEKGGNNIEKARFVFNPGAACFEPSSVGKDVEGPRVRRDEMAGDGPGVVNTGGRGEGQGDRCGGASRAKRAKDVFAEIVAAEKRRGGRTPMLRVGATLPAGGG